jgi:4-hydroxy-tetrahydrodipicolinate reductase
LYEMSLRIAIVGYGKMGRLVERLAPEHGCDVVHIFRGSDNADGQALTRDAFLGTDIAIEFTTPLAATTNVRKLIEAGIPVVTGTTGWFEEIPQVRSLAAANCGSVVWGPNFSVGLHHFRATVAEAARRFAREEAYGAWGWEIHHAAKKDSPSGTLLALTEEISRSGYSKSVSLAANRAGAVPGTHEIGFDSPEDTITLRHTARGREGFARGALRAARWLSGKKGFFEFREIVDELP